MWKIATWNVNSIKVRLPQILAWLHEHEPDILALQEIKVTDENFPRAIIEENGYQVIFAGQKAYNGVAILSKLPAEDRVVDLPEFADPQRRILAASYQDLRVINLYVPNGEHRDSPKYQYKLAWLAAVRAYVAEQLVRYPQMIILGDFNIAPADIDVHDPSVWQDHVLVSDLERQAFAELLQLGFYDSFRLLHPLTQQFSWWDYRALAFQRNHGLRIDHVLVSEKLRSHCSECVMDRKPRSWPQPSDHIPVMLQLQ